MEVVMAIPKSLANELYRKAGGVVPASPKRSKYGNAKTIVDGMTFDSKKEAQRYAELRLEQKAGSISELACQPRYPCHVGASLVCTYIADFSYVRDGCLVVEDVKSTATARNAVYRLKRRLFHACYPHLTITEV